MSKNTKHVKMTSEIIMKDGGEGVIIRKKGSIYQNGRSDSLLKLKTIRADREALVTDVINGTFYLQLPDGVTTFQIGEENIKLDILPKKGDVLTFSYETYSTRAIPVDAQVFRIRKDVTWENIVRDYYENSDNSPNNFPKSEENKNKKKPYGYYKHNKHSNARRILETIAKHNNFDPLVPENWYQFTIRNFRKQQGGDQVYMMYGNSLSKALVDQFPEVNFDVSQFSTTDYWSNIDNRKNLLLKYAKRHNFDPLVADNWYSTTIESLSKMKGGKYMLVFYSGSPAKAISHLFPELKLDFEKFASVPRGYWNNQENRRDFFIKFAKKRGFDPLVAANWYGISFEDYAHQNKGATTLLNYHNSSFQRAVVDLFPEIGADISKFVSKQKRHWEDIRNRRKEFENIAESLGFDPLVADNWYKTKINEILSFKIQAMLLNYKGDPVRALCELFPELNLDPSKFTKVKKINIYDEMRNRRRFFEDFAAANNFDPLVADNWYNIKIENIFAAKGTWIIGLYKKSVVEALFDVFPDIGLNEFKFTDLEMHWSSKSVRRNTMERVAKEFDFDPLVLKNWHNSNIIAKVAPLLYFYDNDITKAVQTLFPETYRGIGVPRYPKFTRKRKVWIGIHRK